MTPPRPTEARERSAAEYIAKPPEPHKVRRLARALAIFNELCAMPFVGLLLIPTVIIVLFAPAFALVWLYQWWTGTLQPFHGIFAPGTFDGDAWIGGAIGIGFVVPGTITGLVINRK